MSPQTPFPSGDEKYFAQDLTDSDGGWEQPIQPATPDTGLPNLNDQTRFSFRRMGLAAAALVMGLTGQAALATDTGLDGLEQEFATKADADAATAISEAVAARPVQEFRNAFDAWRTMDGHGSATSRISVPSRRPVDAMSLSSSWGMRVHPVTGRLARHNGIDVPAPAGTPIYATADGTIGRAQWVNGYGKYVEIEHGSAIQTRYGHMSRIAVAAGQRVKRGDIVGYVGSTGRSTGNHLHYEVRIAGAPVNPLPFVQGTPSYASAGTSGAMGGPE